MNILCVANDIPLPANSGGRVDVWRRLCAFKAAGHNVALICWVDVGRVAPPSDEIIQQLKAVCVAVTWLPITRSVPEILRRSLLLWRWPSHVAARAVTVNKHTLFKWTKAFNPDLIWLDGLYGGAVALQLANQFNTPLWYRSHNIEHRYMAAQCAREQRLIRRLGLLANCFGLARFERKIFEHAQWVFDISLSDAVFWRQKGFVNKVNWLPTLVDAEFAQRLNDADAQPRWDLMYFGNLTTPNNIEAVLWLVQKVLPLLDNLTMRIAIAGSNPAEAVRVAVASDKRITLIANPEDMAAIISSAKVLVNPMQAGSGVNLKSVEMLFTQAALVSTTVGAAGLPAAAQACFSLADNPEHFAEAIAKAFIEPVALESRVLVRKIFSFDAINQVFDHSTGSQ
jgi:polysaccharide biosynthesis protein PslH